MRCGGDVDLERRRWEGFADGDRVSRRCWTGDAGHGGRGLVWEDREVVLTYYKTTLTARLCLAVSVQGPAPTSPPGRKRIASSSINHDQGAELYGERVSERYCSAANDVSPLFTNISAVSVPAFRVVHAAGCSSRSLQDQPRRTPQAGISSGLPLCWVGSSLCDDWREKEVSQLAERGALAEPCQCGDVSRQLPTQNQMFGRVIFRSSCTTCTSIHFGLSRAPALILRPQRAVSYVLRRGLTPLIHPIGFQDFTSNFPKLFRCETMSNPCLGLTNNVFSFLQGIASP